jgi:hypothetical protein
MGRTSKFIKHYLRSNPGATDVDAKAAYAVLQAQKALKKALNAQRTQPYDKIRVSGHDKAFRDIKNGTYECACGGVGTPCRGKIRVNLFCNQCGWPNVCGCLHSWRDEPDGSGDLFYGPNRYCMQRRISSASPAGKAQA